MCNPSKHFDIFRPHFLPIPVLGNYFIKKFKLYINGMFNLLHFFFQKAEHRFFCLFFLMDVTSVKLPISIKCYSCNFNFFQFQYIVVMHKIILDTSLSIPKHHYLCFTIYFWLPHVTILFQMTRDTLKPSGTV